MDSTLITATRWNHETTYVELNRADKRNALSIDLMESFCCILDDLADDPAQRVVVIGAAGNYVGKSRKNHIPRVGDFNESISSEPSLESLKQILDSVSLQL